MLLILVVQHIANLERSRGTRALEVTSRDEVTSSRDVDRILNSSLTDYTKLLYNHVDLPSKWRRHKWVNLESFRLTNLTLLSAPMLIQVDKL